MSLYGRIEELEEQLAERDAEIVKWRRAFENGGTETLQKQLAKWQESSANAAGEALALSHERDKLRKQNVLLREAVLAVCCDPEGKVCIRGSDGDREVIQEALAATADLAGLVVCDAVPVAWHYEGSDIELPSVALSDDLDDEQKQNCTELFARRKEK